MHLVDPMRASENFLFNHEMSAPVPVSGLFFMSFYQHCHRTEKYEAAYGDDGVRRRGPPMNLFSSPWWTVTSINRCHNHGCPAEHLSEDVSAKHTLWPLFPR